MQRKKAFSLAELLISLAVIGMLYAILTPIIRSVTPKTDKVMFKKAYNTIEKTIYNMVNDDSMYPDVELGFAVDTNTSRFCTNFFEYLNTTNYSAGSCSAKTTDGISISISDINFGTSTTVANVTTYTPSESYNTTITARVKNGGSFSVKVRYDGKIKITDDNLINILENPTKNN